MASNRTRRLASPSRHIQTADMGSEIRQCLHAAPFEPFTILTSGGERYAVPTADHASANPPGNRVVVWFNDGSSVMLASLHIVSIEKSS